MKVVTDAVRDFEKEAQLLFEPFDTSFKPRAYSAEQTLSDLRDLTVVQADFLKQGVRSVENSLFRGAIVIAFCAPSDLCADLAARRSKEVLGVRAKWSYSSKHELLESYPDFQIFDALKDAKVVSKSENKTLHSLLHRRNECAHPSDFSPNADEALGYIRETMRIVDKLSKKLK
ncbi:hypothetical protein [Ruegeria arenilitoris]|uniref:hypothetical protein n=1 Tax=Ruegeria arenilitoris TaxID=1173585 RepID=UPI00147AE829|nr:hypothetical protein [Ruegeria arenilitoris]